MFYGYLNPESTKTAMGVAVEDFKFYGYLNPESTKTNEPKQKKKVEFYGYLNPESTKTFPVAPHLILRFTVT